MAYTADNLVSAIVVVGDFNPTIFSPDWMERNNLIGEGDARAVREDTEAKQFLISHQATTFETDWFAIQVMQNQFSLTSKGALSPAFKDLAAGIFQLVSHTPIKAVGLNFLGTFKLASLQDYHKVGDVFAPKAIWDSLYTGEFTGLEHLTVRIQKGTRDKVENTKSEKRITLQPAHNIKYGVGLSINNHHDVSASGETALTSAEQVAIIIDKQWEAAWKDAVRVFDTILSKAVEA